jgi:hypothetical protein
LLLVVSLVLNLLLVAELIGTRSELEALRTAGFLEIGTRVPPLDLKSTSASPIRITYSDVEIPTVLYIMRPSCGWCKTNNPNLKAMLASAGDAYRLHIISLDEAGVEEYRQAYRIGESILIGVTDDARDIYHMGGTPQTVVVSPAGIVTHMWMGAYSPAQEREIEDTLGVELPGRLPAASSGGT